MSEAAPFDPADPAAFRFWEEDRVRFADLDPVGHANNAAIAGFLETGRVALMEACGASLGHGGRSPALVRITIDYRRELRLDERVHIGVRPTRLGRSSITIACTAFAVAPDGELSAAALSESVVVLIDLATRRSVPLDDELRTALQAHFGP